MNRNSQQEPDIVPWKRYTITLLQVSLAFTIATFCIILFMTKLNHDLSTIICAVIMVALYLFVIVFCIRKLIMQLSIAALMLMVPIAPLAVLLLVVSLLPIIQKLQ